MRDESFIVSKNKNEENTCLCKILQNRDNPLASRVSIRYICVKYMADGV